MLINFGNIQSVFPSLCGNVISLPLLLEPSKILTAVSISYSCGVSYVQHTTVPIFGLGIMHSFPSFFVMLSIWFCLLSNENKIKKYYCAMGISIHNVCTFCILFFRLPIIIDQLFTVPCLKLCTYFMNFIIMLDTMYRYF